MIRWIILAVWGLTCAWAQAQDSGATTQPASAVIQASDKEAIAAAMGNQVVVEGTIASAAWSRSGKVMNIEFADTSESGLLAVIFERSRADMDAAFGGDIGKALTGSKVRLKGTLQPYGGRSEAMKGRPQIIINRGDQITIVEAAKAPATQP
jgi:DNA/RNA endonuclease YhcR with UshA esterase domain